MQKIYFPIWTNTFGYLDKYIIADRIISIDRGYPPEHCVCNIAMDFLSGHNCQFQKVEIFYSKQVDYLSIMFFLLVEFSEATYSNLTHLFFFLSIQQLHSESIRQLMELR